MNVRSPLCVAGLAAGAALMLPLGFFSSAKAQTGIGGTPNPQTGLLPDPALPSGMTYASGRTIARYSLFGSDCCIQAENAVQGALGDCFFMSSMDTVAMVSPSTILKAIQYNPVSDTYTIKFYLPPVGPNVTPTEAWVPQTYTTSAQVPVQSVTTTLWNNSFPFIHPEDAWNALISPQVGYARTSPSANVLWPLLLEKGYAAIHPNGYNSIAKGGYAKDALRALTGKPSTMWLIPDTNYPLQMTLKNMPLMADVGEHSVLGGLLTGKGFTAIEPDIQVCVTGQAQTACTAVCKPGHECTGRFLNSGKIDVANETLKVEVFDVPSISERNEVAEFRKAPGKCMDGTTCQVAALKSAKVEESPPLSITFQSIAPATISVGNQDGSTTEAHTLTSVGAIATVLDKLTDHNTGKPIKPVTIGTIPECPFEGLRCVAATSAYFNVGPITTGGLVPGHEYYLIQYNRNSATVLVGNPWGREMPPPISLAVFQKTFLDITANDEPANAKNCSCDIK